MNPPFRAYEGTEPYLFISYAHADRERVFPEMQWMQEQGYRFWFDEGIQVGSEWSERIAQAIHGCAQFLVFLTPRSAESGHVKEEIYYAYQKGKSVISIYLESTTLPEGLEMRLAPLQALHRFALGEAAYREKLLDALREAAQGGEKAVGQPSLIVEPNKPYVNSLGMEMIWCPPGHFLMGSSVEEEGRFDHEQAHETTITQGFWMGKTPVTQGHWESLFGENPSHFREAGPQAPVEQVTWDEGQAFVRRLSEREGLSYVLPTEAQWEYACRAGTTGPYAGTSLEEMGWYEENSGGQTHPVGQKFPNPWGFSDFHGNVWEWCDDGFRAYGSAPVTDPVGPEEDEFRVVRGGCRYAEASLCRSASRFRYTQDHRGNSVGFRVCVEG